MNKRDESIIQINANCSAVITSCLIVVIIGEMQVKTI